MSEIIRCPQCSESFYARSAIYCPRCGALLPERTVAQQAPGNRWVRFLGGLCVFVGIAVLIISCVWSYQTFTDETIASSGQDYFGLISQGQALEREIRVRASLFILASGFILTLMLEAMGEGLILIAQVREEQFQIAQKLERMSSG